MDFNAPVRCSGALLAFLVAQLASVGLGLVAAGGDGLLAVAHSDRRIAGEASGGGWGDGFDDRTGRMGSAVHLAVVAADSAAGAVTLAEAAPREIGR